MKKARYTLDEGCRRILKYLHILKFPIHINTIDINYTYSEIKYTPSYILKCMTSVINSKNYISVDVLFDHNIFIVIYTYNNDKLKFVYDKKNELKHITDLTNDRKLFRKDNDVIYRYEYYNHFHKFKNQKLLDVARDIFHSVF